MHLLLDCVNLLSTTGKLYLMACSDAKRSNSGNSYFVQISWNTLGDSSICLSFGNFWKPIWPHDVFRRCRFPNLFRNGYHLLALFITSPPPRPAHFHHLWKGTQVVDLEVEWFEWFEWFEIDHFQTQTFLEASDCFTVLEFGDTISLPLRISGLLSLQSKSPMLQILNRILAQIHDRLVRGIVSYICYLLLL